MTRDQDHQSDGIAALISAITSQRSPEYDESYGAMIDNLRDFLDALAAADIAVDDAEELSGLFAQWTPRLHEVATDDFQRPWGHVLNRAGHGQTLVPKVYDTVYEDHSFSGKTIFGRFHVGENMAAHGGAIAVLFDDFLGWLLLKTDLPPSRTAYLKTDFKAITPIGEELEIVGRVDRIEGRKRFLSAELKQGDTVCAQAEGLWVELLPGQG
ncbi:MAG TPA: PaaI family thioesterase [Marmoricola sp.]|nr:PaaI family thioesterase [Marmoricola sp.]